jgi:hypothetical protein
VPQWGHTHTEKREGEEGEGARAKALHSKHFWEGATRGGGLIGGAKHGALYDIFKGRAETYRKPD